MFSLSKMYLLSLILLTAQLPSIFALPSQPETYTQSFLVTNNPATSESCSDSITRYTGEAPDFSSTSPCLLIPLPEQRKGEISSQGDKIPYPVGGEVAVISCSTHSNSPPATFVESLASNLDDIRNRQCQDFSASESCTTMETSAFAGVKYCRGRGQPRGAGHKCATMAWVTGVIWSACKRQFGANPWNVRAQGEGEIRSPAPGGRVVVYHTGFQWPTG
ncbi:hypothetical protein BJ508DRAFT_312157 [Ascobolus immersus RN42]|uniref:Uncharacterized protein n=1 Tax=Ascobolus immersus RN42 TaxID=1160509 RepID=A0A3N4HN50_ASCIM|nr:hypothetical protein BJ508DRAFT_312157 [Ascobolus immersus RN42]